MVIEGIITPELLSARKNKIADKSVERERHDAMALCQRTHGVSHPVTSVPGFCELGSNGFVLRFFVLPEGTQTLGTIVLGVKNGRQDAGVTVCCPFRASGRWPEGPI